MLEKCLIILLGAGIGKRFSRDSKIKIEKQYYIIDNNKTIFELCIENVLDLNLKFKILPVVHKTRFDYFKKISNKYKILPPIIGGETRQISVIKSLKFIKKYNPKYVLIHDVARPFLNKSVISNLFKNINNKVSCVVPYLNLSDAIRKIDKNGKLNTLNKSDYCLLQTPQLCNYQDLYNAYKHDKKTYDDDSSVLLENKFNIKKILGDKKSIKITNFNDLDLIKNFTTMKMKNYITKVGIGYDIHKLKKNNKICKNTKYLKLGGVNTIKSYSLLGHSDADVILHSLTDSIYGALNFGDIGQHFPPSEKKWKNYDSSHFLKHAVKELYLRDGRILHIDIVVITEIPKISTYSYQIRKNISRLIDINESKISIKGKSNEGIGAIGRKEGIAVFTNSTLSIRELDDC